MSGIPKGAAFDPDTVMVPMRRSQYEALKVLQEGGAIILADKETCDKATKCLDPLIEPLGTVCVLKLPLRWRPYEPGDLPAEP